MNLYRVHYTTDKLIPFGDFELVEALKPNEAEETIRIMNKKAREIFAVLYMEAQPDKDGMLDWQNI